MSEMVNSVSSTALPADSDSALVHRIARTMIVASTLAVIVSAVMAPWRVTTGLLLGGLLALINHHWLQTSIAAVFNVEEGKRPRIRAWRFVMRYFIVGAVVFSAYQLHLVSLPATLIGLSSFVVALFGEAFREFYYAIIRREETD